MNSTEQVNISEWASITIERWEKKIASYRFSKESTGDLLRSFRAHVENDANGDAAKVTFTFLYYGYYWDAGVGRGYTRGNSGDLKNLSDWAQNNGAGHRKKHRWFNKIYWREFNNLARMMADRYGSEFVNDCVRQFTHKMNS